MNDPRPTFEAECFDQPIEIQLPRFIDEHRAYLATSLDLLTEDEARRHLVPSLTTPLGIVKHCTFVELVWFEEAVNHVPRTDFGFASDIDESFTLDDTDTIESVTARYRQQCDRSRQIMANLTLDTIVTGNRRGPIPVRWVYLHVLRELAQHCGHADILREQLLAARQ